MRDYSKAKIYKLINLSNDECVIGSTTEPRLSRRLAGLVTAYNRYKATNKFYSPIYKILSDGNYKIQLIEKYPCASPDELHAREVFWINSTPCLNKAVN